MSWNTNTGTVRFWNQSQTVCEHFQDFFEDTFGLRLVPDSPYTAALKYGLTEEETALLDRLETTVFHTNVG